MGLKPTDAAHMQQTSGAYPWHSQMGHLRPAPPRPEYANRVKIERREHDATLRFFRDTNNQTDGTMVGEMIVPLALLTSISLTEGQVS